MASKSIVPFFAFSILTLVLLLVSLDRPAQAQIRTDSLTVDSEARRATIGPVPLPGVANLSGMAPPTELDAATQTQIKANALQLPLSFEPNRGQTDPQVTYLARGPGYSLFLAHREAVLVMQKAAASSVVRMQLLGANPQPQARGLEPLPGTSNYFAGNDPQHWHTDIPSYRKVEYQDVYPGVDLVYYGKQRYLEYDFVVHPGADPDRISLGFEGVQGLSIDANGDLVLSLSDDGSELRFQAPVVYQTTRQGRQIVPSSYRITAEGQVSFEVASYDKTRPLIIDPTLLYASYLGGIGSDTAYGIATDTSGNVYVTGYTASSDYPTTSGVYDTSLGGSGDAFVAKFDPTQSGGSSLVYSTYLGGAATEWATAIRVDASGNAYLTGYTQSSDFPTQNAYDTSLNGSQNAFLAKLNASGTALLYSTYLGGGTAAYGNSIALDASNMAYLTGWTQSSDFPTTAGVHDTGLSGTQDAFVAKFDTALSGASSLLYSTYLGGSNNESGYAITVDAAGNAYLTGFTNSTDFPVTGSAYDNSHNGNNDVFVAKFNSTASAMTYATYLGSSTSTSGENGLSIAIDSADKIYVAGEAVDTNFPTTGGAYDTSHNSGRDVFVAKFDPTLSGASSLVYSTFIGGSGDERGEAIAVDTSGNAYVGGYTKSSNFPTSPDAYDAALGGTEDAILAKLSADGSSLSYSTYLGGSGNDRVNAIDLDTTEGVYLSGYTRSSNFPTSASAYDTALGGTQDAFVVKFQMSPLPTLSSAANQAFTVGDSTTAISTMTVTDDSNTATITAANDIRIRIPSGFNMSWDTADTTATLGGGASAKVSTTVSYEDAGQTLVLDVTSDFAVSDQITIAGLSFTSFTETSAADNLELEVNNDGEASATDDKTITVNGPTLSSAADQTFRVGDALTAISTLTVTDGSTAPTVTAANDIRIRIPSGFTMSWDTSDTTATIGDGASAKVSPTVSYEDSGKTLVLNVTTDFAAADQITIADLSFTSFTAAAAPDNLELEVNNDGVVQATDNRTVSIVDLSFSSAANQTFTVGDATTAISTMTVTDDSVAPVITAANDIRIRIPSAFTMSWDTSDTTATIGGGASAKVSPTVSYEDSGKTLVLNVTTDFAAADQITIADLSFTSFTTAAPAGNLELEVDNNGAVAANDDKTVLINAAGNMAVATGAYTGDGLDNRVISKVGFQPDVVIIKAANSAEEAVCRTSAMPSDAAKPLGGATTLQSAMIKSLDDNEFTIGTDNTVNASGASYHWVAFKAAAGELKVGSYPGNGTDDHNITGVGFQPDYVMVMGDVGKEPVHRSSSQSGDTSLFFKNTSPTTDLVQALQADGFQVGKSDRVNKSGITYYYIAWKGVAGSMSVGSYGGNSTDNTDVNTVGFEPAYVIVKQDGGKAGLHRTASLSGDNTLFFTPSTTADDRLQALQSDGFEIGANDDVNKSGETYFWMAFARHNPTAIDLLAFTAEGQNGSVQVAWKTAQEISNLGFHLYRGTRPEGPFQRLTHRLIPGQLSSVMGKTYVYTDTQVTRRASYYYRLEDIDLEGKRTRHGPIGVNWESNGRPKASEASISLSATPKDRLDHEKGHQHPRHKTVDPSGPDSKSPKATDPNTAASQIVSAATHPGLPKLGYYLYREHSGRRSRIVPQMVPGLAVMTPSDAARAVERLDAGLDTAPEGEGPVSYWLEGVALDGSRTWHGPIQPGGSGEPLPPHLQSGLSQHVRQQHDKHTRALKKRQQVRAKLRESLPGGFRPSALTAGQSPHPIAVSLRKHLKEHAPTRSSFPLSRDETQEHLPRQWALAASSALKLGVREEGWYQVRQPDLVAAGLDSGVDPRALQLWADGQEHPLVVQGEHDGRFDPEDAIAFYGQGLDTPSTDTRLYWLVVGDHPGQRVALAPGQETGMPGPQSFLNTVEHKERTFYFAALRNGNKANFFGPTVSTESVDQVVRVPYPDRAASHEALLEVRLQGATQVWHQVKVLLNDVEVGEVTFDGLAQGKLQVPLDQAGLLDGDNLVTLVAQGGESDISVLETIRVTYWRAYRADEDVLQFTAQGGDKLSIPGFSAPDIQVVDITDAHAVMDVPGEVEPEGEGFTLGLRVPGSGERTLFAFIPDGIRKPHELTLNRPSTWHAPEHGADLVIITHEDFVESLLPLVERREAQGLSVALIEVDDLYDEFTFGHKSPQALKDFFSHALTYWHEPPQFVLLVGDASFDPRNHLGFGGGRLCPHDIGGYRLPGDGLG